MLAAFVAVVAAGASTSTASVPSSGVQSVVTSVGLTVVAVFAVSLAVMIGHALARRNRGPEEVTEARHSTFARLAALVVVFGLLALLVLLIRELLHPRRRRPETAGLVGSSPVTHLAHGGGASAFDPTASLATLGVLALLAAAVLARRYLARRRVAYRGLSPLPTPSPLVPGPVEPAGADPSTAAADPPAMAAYDPYAEADPRLAVVSAYLSFTSAMARSGTGRMEHETPAEFSNRIGTSARLAGDALPAVGHLTSCFNAARYGDGPVTEADRSACLADLDEIVSLLEAPA